MPDQRPSSDFIPETLAIAVAFIVLAALTAWSVGWLASDPLAAASCGKSDAISVFACASYQDAVSLRRIVGYPFAALEAATKGD